MESVVTNGAASGAPPTRSVDELWLDVFQQVSGRLAHELKGALNGVAVNLEVVRSRSVRADASAASVSTFASSAADQLEVVVSMTEAFLLLGRAPREPVDVSNTVECFTTLLAPAARADGGSLRVELPSRELMNTSVRAPGTVVRLVIGAALLAALSRKGDIRCRVSVGEHTVVQFECADGEGPLELPADILAVATASGIAVQGDVGGRTVTLTFPRASAARKRPPERA
jgi:hypothetical protein